MRSFILMLSLAAMFIAPNALAEAMSDENVEVLEDMERQIEETQLRMELNRLEREIQQEEIEMDYQQQLRELELRERLLEVERLEQQGSHHEDGGFAVILLLCLIVHILAASWVYKDINSRKAGSGLWIAITLIAGLMGALVYAVVRLGDMHPTVQEK